MSIPSHLKAPFAPPQQISSGLRNSYGTQQSSNLTKTQGPKFYAISQFSMQNQSSNQQSQPIGYNMRLKNMQIKIQGFQAGTRKMSSDANIGSSQSRRNSSDAPDLKNINTTPMAYYQSKIEESQRDADLRGSCPNIFKKMEQSGLRNTTHWNGSFKSNIPLDVPSNNSTNASMKDQLSSQIKPTSFLKHQSPKNQVFYGSQVSHSIVVQDKEQNPREQPTNKFGKPNTSKSSIQTNQKTAHMAFMASKFNNKNQGSLQSISENKSQCSTSDKIKTYKTLNQIADSKSHIKSEELGREQLMKILKENPGKKSKVIGGFQIGRVLGKGKFGQVLLGRHKQTGLIAALKKIVKATVKQYKMVKQLKDQIMIHSALDHPNIVRFFGYFEDGDDFYLVIEYMNGGTLFDYLADRDRLSVRQTADFLRDIINALDYMHDKSIAHRDIKPENIVLSSEGVAKLCDFGWTAFIGNSRSTYCGTFQYVCPQILQRKDYDASVDLWCIGILTYQLLTGSVPFQGQIRNDIKQKIINVDSYKIEYPVNVPEQAKDFIQALIRKDPSLRPKCKELLKHDFIVRYASAISKKKL